MIKLMLDASSDSKTNHPHDYYIPLQIIHDFQEQEEVYMVYDKRTGKLLRIYRKKYWTRPQE